MTSSLPSLALLHAAGCVSSLDRRMAEALCRLAGDVNPLTALAVAAVSHAASRGRLCLRLTDYADQPVRDASGRPMEGDPRWPTIAAWRMALTASPLVGRGDGPHPLVLDADDRLYLARLWRYDQTVSQRLAERIAAQGADLSPTLNDLLASFARDATLSPDQLNAARRALARPFGVISGGPGSGKTYTLAVILLALALDAHARHEPPLRLLLMAPSGKAAGRLTESLRSALGRLRTLRPDLPAQLLAGAETAACTIHRALGASGGAIPRFRRRRDDPLVADVAVVDEMSMVDLPLFHHLLDALPADCRLILVGDPRQLGPVESGSVLHDLAIMARNASRPEQTLPQHSAFGGRSGAPRPDELPLSMPLPSVSAPRPVEAPSVVFLSDLSGQHRYQAGSGIASLARLITSGDVVGVMNLLDSSTDNAVQYIDISSDYNILSLKADVLLEELFPPLSASLSEEELAASLSRARVLCGLREGPWGVEAFNRRMMQRLQPNVPQSWETPLPHGAPVLVTRNDYGTDLFNGDLGVASQAQGRTTVLFPRGDGGLRRLSPGRLPAHEPAWAMTIHKSQGSEFDTVLAALPPAGSPLLSRELFYTGVTRARSRLLLWADRQAIRDSVKGK